MKRVILAAAIAALSFVVQADESYVVPQEKCVPAGYVQVSYIECTGGQFMDTGVFPDSSLRVKVSYQTDDTDHNKMIFGVRNSGWHALVWLGNNAGTIINPVIGTKDSVGTKDTGVEAGGLIDLDFSINGISVNGATIYSGAELSAFDSTGVSTRSLILFGLMSGGVMDGTSGGRKYVGKCYGCEIWSGGRLVRDYLPCREASGLGRAGFYDLVSGTFCLPDMGAFTAGSDVVPDVHSLVIRGLPDETIAALPAYGTYAGVLAGSTVPCKVAETERTAGDATWTLDGYVVTTNRADGAKDVIASGSTDEFTLTMPSADAELTWTWKVAAPLAVALPVASDVNVSAATVATTVSGLGPAAESADVVFRYGTSSDALDAATDAVTLTNAGEVRVRLTRLQPGTTYHLKAVVENGAGATVESDVVTFTTAGAGLEVEHLKSVSTDGTQFFYSDFKVNAYTRLEIDFKWLDTTKQYRAFSCECQTKDFLTAGIYRNGNGNYAYQHQDTSQNTVNTGITAPADHILLTYDMPNSKLTVYDYDQGKVTVDGITMGGTCNGTSTRNCVAFAGQLSDDLAGGLPTAAQFTQPTKAAYYGIRVYEGDELVRDYIPARVVATGEVGLYDRVKGKMMTVIGDAAKLGVDENYGRAFTSVSSVGMVATLEFAAARAAGDLYRLADIEDRGSVSTEGWARCEKVATIPAAETSVVVQHPADWGTAVAVERFFFVTGSETNFSPAVCWKSMAAPLAISAPSPTSFAFGSATVSVLASGLGLSATSADVTVFYGESHDDLDHSTAAVSLELPGQVLFTLNALVSGKTYFFKAVASNDVNEVVVSDVIDFVQPEVAEPGIPLGGRADLPAGFVQMKKLVSTGAEYIKTDIVPPSGTMSAEAEFGDMTFGQSTIVFGQETYAAKQYMFGITDYNGSGEVFAFWGAGTLLQTAPNRMPADPGCDYSVRITPTSSNNGTITVSNKTQGTSATITDTLVAAASKKLQIFRSGDQTHNVKCALYSARFWSGSTLLGDFVPAYEPATGKVGLYDFVTQALYESAATAFARQDFVCTPLELLNGQFVMKVPASDTVRTAVLCWGETYGGIDEWASTSTPVTIPAGATTVSYPIPAGWGKTVWFARAKVGAGDDALWSKTMMAEPPAPLGVEKPTLASSAFGSSVVAANVTGIGKTASEATLVFEYGTASDALDHTLPARVIDNAGTYEVTIPHLIAGTHCYVKAVLSNDVNEVVVSDVIDFVQPEVAEPGAGIPSAGPAHSPMPIGYDEATYLDFDGNEYFTLPTTFTTASGFGFAMDAQVKSRSGDYGPHILNLGSFWAVYRVDGIYLGSPNVVITKDKDGNSIYPDKGIGHDFAIDFNTANDGKNCINGAEVYNSFSISGSCGSSITIGAYSGDVNSSAYRFVGRLYYVRLYDHGTLKMNLVPCVKRGATPAEDVVGLYDTENPDPTTAFVANLGTGHVTAGELIPRVARLEFQGGKFVVTLEASDEAQTVSLFANQVYGGTNDWGAADQTVTVPAGATTAEFDKPAGWGSTVYFVRAKVGEGRLAFWSKTLIAEPPAPLGMNQTLSLVSSAFGSSVVAAQVTGIGLTASEATLVFGYGTTPDCADGSVELSVTDAGEWRGTIPHLAAGKTYYVKATLENDKGDTPVVSDVLPVVQPELAEEGGDPRIRPLPDGYVQMEKLTSKGSEYIVTDWKPDNKTSSEAELGEFTSVGESAVFGQAYSGSQYLMTVQGSQFRWYGGGTPVCPDNQIPMDGTKYQIKIDALGTGNGNITVLNRSTGASAPVPNLSLAVGSGNFAVFAANDGSKKACCSIYSFKAWKNGEISIDLVPAYEAETGTAGLYDLKGRKFYSSKDTAFERQSFVEDAVLTCRGDKLVLTVPAPAAADTAVSLFAGENYGGVDGWGAAVETKTVAAGATTVEFDLPTGWGKTVWFARAKIGEGDDAHWSKTLVAADADLPSVTLDSLDGVGGDTMVVKGTVESLGGTSCTLTAYVGPDENSLTNVWANVDGSILTDAGDFTLELFEDDTTAPRYLVPGETNFVRVVATSSNGKTAWSNVRSVTMAKEAAFKSQSAAFSKRMMTVTAQMSDLGMTGKTMVELWVGADAGSLAKVAGPVAVTNINENFTLSYELPHYETPYFWQLKAVNTSEGGTDRTTVESETASQTAQDTATYTWTGAGSDNKWSNSGNWSSSAADCIGYPASAGATATINMKATIDVDVKTTLKTLTLGGSWLDLTLRAENATDYGITASMGTPPAASHITLDGVSVAKTGGGQWNMPANSTFELKNGAVFTSNDGFYPGNAANVKLLLSGCSSMTVAWLYTGVDSYIELDDSSLTVNSYTFNLGYVVGDTVIRFKGKAPCLTSAVQFYIYNASAHALFDFVVPVGGYDAAPVVANGGFNMSGKGPVQVRISDESPAARVDETLESVPLIRGSIGKANVETIGLEDTSLTSDFIWDESATPKALSVKIAGSTHEHGLTVAGVPEEVLGDRISPTYGHNDDGEPKTLTAPEGTVYFADDTRRATCLGWKLYDMDSATHEATLSDSGTGNSYGDWTSPGHWQKFEWQWKVESKVVASAGEGGTAAVSSEWVTEGETVTITATPGEGRSFYRWTRNGSGETFSRDAVLTLPVTEPAVFTAEFAGIVHVAANGGHDDTGDGSSANPFATLQKALTVAEPGDEIRLQDGEYHMDDPFTLIETNVTVRSANGPDGCLLMPATNSANSSARGIIQVLHADAVVDGLTLRGGNFYGGNKPHSPIIVTAGLVRNCIIRNNAGGTSGGGDHGGVTMSGGVIRDCVLFSNYSRYNNGGTGVGGALYLTAGLVENCVITNNGAGAGGGGVYLTGANSVLRRCYLGNNHGEATTTGWRNAGSGGGVSVGVGALVELCTICGNLANNGAGAYLAGGTIRNSLIVGNHGLNAGAGVYNNGGTVVNCTIADNDSSGTTSGTGLRQTLGSTVNTVIYGNPCGAEGDTLVEGGAFAHNFTTLEIPGAEPEDGNVFGNVFYRDAENGDYRLSVGSKAVDAATPVEGVVTDLSGVARPQGAAPDIGCYECVSGEGGLTCVFNPPDKTIFLDEGEATFTASADGADTVGLSYAWYFDGVLQADQTGSTSLWSAMGLGAHTVKVVVRNAAGEEASCELKDVVKVTTTHVFANENGSNTYPYDTPEKGAPQLQDALDAVWVPETGTATVTACPGTYECLSRWFIIKQPIVIESSEGPENTILKAGAPSAGARRVVNLNHPGAVLRGLTLTGGNWDGTLGDSGPGALRLEAGTVTNCIIRNNRGCYKGGGVQMSGGLLTDCEICTNSCIYNTGATDTRGGGVYMTGGTVVGCRVHDCYACTGGDTGGGVWASGGVVRDCEIYANYSGTANAHGIGVCVSGTALVENCAITNNPRAGQAVNNAAGVYMTGGTMRNCLVAGNTAVESGAGVWQSGGTLEFCTVAGNVSQNRAGSGVRLDGAAAVCRYNVISANGAGVEAEPTCNIAFLQAADFSRNVVQPATAGTDNIGEAPGFVDAAAGDWTLGAGSPAIDAAVGLDEDYLAYDLVGNRRPKDGDGDGTAACDLGCYEAADASEGPLSCSFSPAESRGIDEVTVTFEASAIGQGSTGELHYDWDFGGGVLVGDSSDVPNPTVRYGSFGSFDVSLTVTAAGGAQAEKAVEGCVKVGTDKIFVVQENENARWPYATWETAATNLNEAFNSMIMVEGRPPTITLSNGTYRVGQKAFVLGFPIRITSVEGPEKTIVQAYYPDGDVYLGWRLGVFWVEHPEAMVDGVTMTGAKWYVGEGGASALRLSAGVVSNCVIRNSSSIANGYGAVQVSGTGRLTHSAIINCSGSWGSSSGASSHGAGLTLDGAGLVEWTVISNCTTSTAGVSSSGGGVYMKGGTLRDSSVLDCATFNNWDGSAIWQTGGLCERCVFGDSAHENGYGAAVYLTGGTNRNNVIRRAWTSKGAVQALQMSGGRFWNNTVVTNGWASTQESPVAASVTGGEVKNCIFACNKGADVDDAGERVSFSRFAEATDARGNTAADPRFRNLDKPVWTLSGSSPCANRGDMSIWAEESAPVDFLRKPRIKNRRVDMGACECQVGGTVIIVR